MASLFYESLYYNGEPMPFGNAVVECTHCQHSMRLSEVSIKNVPPPVFKTESPLLLSPTFSASEEDLPMTPEDNSPELDQCTDEETVRTDDAEVELSDLSELPESVEDKKWRWSQELKEHFVRAFESLQTRGIHATPKKIMSLMRANGAPIEQLTMRRVQSHHQKYLKRQKNQKTSKKARHSRGSHKLLSGSGMQQQAQGLSDSQGYDVEVSQLTANGTLQQQQQHADVHSCHSSPRGSPMIFSGGSHSPVPAARQQQLKEELANGQLSALLAHKANHTFLSQMVNRPASSDILVRPQASFIQQQFPERASAQKLKPSSSTLASLSAANPAMWQYMMSNTVVKPTEGVAVASSTFSVSSSSAFGAGSRSSSFVGVKHEGSEGSDNIFGDLVGFPFDQQSLLLMPPSLKSSQISMDQIFYPSAMAAQSEENDHFNLYELINEQSAVMV